MAQRIAPTKSSSATSSNEPDAVPAAPTAHRHAIVRYTAMRAGLFAVVLGLLWLVPVKGVLLVALALVISGLASYVLLGPQRDAMSAEMVAARERRRVKAAGRAAREDHLQDANDDPAGPAS